MTDRMCHRCFAKLRAGDFLLDDARRLGRPVEVDSNPTETLIENDQCYTTQERADILKISQSIKLLVTLMNDVSLISWKKLNGLFGQPNIRKTMHIACVFAVALPHGMQEAD